MAWEEVPAQSSGPVTEGVGENPDSVTKIRKSIVASGHANVSIPVDAFPPEVQPILREVDDEGNGLLEMDELAEVFGKYVAMKNANKAGTIDISLQPKNMQELLRCFDMNQNGHVDGMELARAAELYRDEKTKSKRLARVLMLVLGILVIALAAMFGLVFAVVELSKETKTGGSGVMTVAGKDDVVVATASQIDYATLSYETSASTLDAMKDVSLAEGTTQLNTNVEAWFKGADELTIVTNLGRMMFGVAGSTQVDGELAVILGGATHSSGRRLLDSHTISGTVVGQTVATSTGLSASETSFGAAITPVLAVPAGSQGWCIECHYEGEDAYALLRGQSPDGYLGWPGGYPYEAVDQGHQCRGEATHTDFAHFQCKESPGDIVPVHMQVYLGMHDCDASSNKVGRQRNELKLYDKSPEELLLRQGETINYSWKFKVSPQTLVSKRFTHFMQLKFNFGSKNAAFPLLTFTGSRYSSGYQAFQVRFANFEKLGPGDNYNLIGTEKIYKTGMTTVQQWLQAELQITAVNGGTMKLALTRLSDGVRLLNHESHNRMLWREGNSYIRPKWGIYRKVTGYEHQLNDAECSFQDFCIHKHPMVDADLEVEDLLDEEDEN